MAPALVGLWGVRLDWRLVAAAVAILLVLGGGTILAAQVQGDLDAGVQDVLGDGGGTTPRDTPPLKLNDFKLPGDMPLEIPEGSIVSPDLSKLTLPEDLDLEIPHDLDLSNLDFELPEDFDLQLPAGSIFSPGGLDLPEGGSIKLPDGRSFDLPPGSHLDLPAALAERLRQAGVPSGVPLPSDLTTPIRGLPEGTHARLDPPQFSGGGTLRLPAGTSITLPPGQRFPFAAGVLAAAAQYLLPAGTTFDIPFDAEGSAGGAFPVPQPRSSSQLSGRGSGTGAGGSSGAAGIAVTTEITDMPSRVRKGEAVVVGGYVRELATGRPVVGAPVDVFMNETKRQPGVLVGEGVTGSDGTFKIALDLPEDKPASNYQLVDHALAFVDASGRAFADGWGDPPFATYASTVLTLSVPSQDGVGSSTPISGRLLDHTGAPVPGLAVNVVVDGVTIARPVTTDAGTFATTYAFTAGTHAVSARFLGTSNYDASAAGPVDITVTSYVLEIPAAARARPGQDLALAGRLLDDGVALVGRDVEIAGLPFGAATRTATTDGAGRFALTLAVPADQRAGSTTLRYRVADLGIDKPQLLEVNESGRLVLTAPTLWDVEVPFQALLTLHANGTDARALADQPVRLTLAGPGGSSEAIVVTDASGEVSSALAPLRPMPGTYTLTARVIAPANLQVGVVTTTVALGAFEVAWEAPGALARGESAAISGVVRFAGRPYDAGVTLGVLAYPTPLTLDADGRFTYTATIPRETAVGPANLTLGAEGHPTRTFPVSIVSAATIEIDAPAEFPAADAVEMGLRLVDDVGDPIRGSLVTLTTVGPRGSERTLVRTDDEGRWRGPVNLSAQVGDNVTLSARFDATGPYHAADTTRVLSATAPVVKGPVSPLLWIVPLAVLAIGGAGAGAWYVARQRRSRAVPVAATASATAAVAAPVMRAADFDVRFGIPADEPAVWGVGEPLELVVQNRGAAGEIELAWPGGSRRVMLGPNAAARTTVTFAKEGDVPLTAHRASDAGVAPATATVRIVDYPKETAREFELFLEKAQAIDPRLGKRSTPREIEWALAAHLGADAERQLAEIALVIEVTNYSNDATRRTRAHYLRFVRASRALDPFLAPRADAAPSPPSTPSQLPPPPPPPRRG